MPAMLAAARPTEHLISQPLVRPSQQPPFWRHPRFLGLLLVWATILAYQPVWHGGFIWDDDVYVIKNKLLTAPDGLRRIWFSEDSPSQYFPLVYSMFRVEYALWGLNPAGYHWVNILFQAANALLVWRLLKRLELPGAWLAAALFALHPVQVESVAWITERKNLLSLFFVLWSLLAWLAFIEERPKRWGFYTGALVLYLLALFSKTTACTVPAALVVSLWLKRKPITRWRWAQIAPFVAMGLGMGLLTMWWERHHIGTNGGVFAIGPLERVLIASRGVWFYAWKLLWPVNLTFSYPRWVIHTTDPLAYAWLALGVLFCGLLLFARRYAGRGPLLAAAYYVATLAPTLGFIMLFTFRYSFVADHYQYMACIGPFAMVAAGLAVVAKRLRQQRPWLEPVFCGLLVLGLGSLTWRQAQAYKDVETLWRDTVRKNPDSWLARYNLSRDLLHRGQFDEALEEYRQALRTGPNTVDGLVSVGNALFAKGRQDEAMEFYERALQVNPDNPEAHVNLAVILANRGQIEEAMEHDRKAIQVNPKHITAHVNLAVALASQGRFKEALEHYAKALEVNPDQPMTHINLAIALNALGQTNQAQAHFRKAAEVVNAHAAGLATQGRLDEAVAQYREGIRLIPNNPEAHCGLGLVLLRLGNAGEAREEFSRALELRPGYQEAQRQLNELH